MNNILKPAKLLYLLLATFAASYWPSSLLAVEAAVPNLFSQQPSVQPPTYDTVKYLGYRLHLTDFEILKKTEAWVKIKCTIINSGRNDVDFTKKGTEHWVQVNFDPSIFDQKLGGLRENIRQAMYDENLRLAAGGVLRGKTLKVSTMPAPASRIEPEPLISFTDPAAGRENSGDSTVFSKGGNEAPLPEEPASFQKEAEECPDLFFFDLRIVSQDDKWATLEYIVENQGKGAFQLLDRNAKNQEKLAIRAYISGVPVLSRGALPVGGQFVRIEAGNPEELPPGGKHTGRIRLDIRKKTRYMKSLILSLESDQFHFECDKTNNTGAVVLD